MASEKWPVWRFRAANQDAQNPGVGVGECRTGLEWQLGPPWRVSHAHVEEHGLHSEGGVCLSVWLLLGVPCILADTHAWEKPGIPHTGPILTMSPFSPLGPGAPASPVAPMSPCRVQARGQHWVRSPHGASLLRPPTPHLAVDALAGAEFVPANLGMRPCFPPLEEEASESFPQALNPTTKYILRE